MKRDRIHSAGPNITQAEIEAVTHAATEGWYSNYMDEVEAFEREFAAYAGVKYALATTCGTSALHLAMAASGIGPGDEVIVPDISWATTPHVVKYCGADVVWADVDPEVWCLDPDSMKKALTPRTKAIFPVHLYGHPAPLDEIMAFAAQHGLTVIEDAAPAIGSKYKGRQCGTFGKAAGFSFQGAKLAVTGEGGMFVTDDEEVFRHAERLISQGRDDSLGMFHCVEVGFQYNMANLLAALGRVQLRRVDELIANKRQLFDWYYDRLGSIEGIFMLKEKEGCFSNCAYPSMIIDPQLFDRDELRNQLKARNIDTRPLFPRMSRFPHLPDADDPVAERVGSTGINLPTAGYLDEQDVDDICGVIKDIIGL